MINDSFIFYGTRQLLNVSWWPLHNVKKCQPQSSTLDTILYLKYIYIYIYLKETHEAHQLWNSLIKENSVKESLNEEYYMQPMCPSSTGSMKKSFQCRKTSKNITF